MNLSYPSRHSNGGFNLSIFKYYLGSMDNVYSIGQINNEVILMKSEDRNLPHVIGFVVILSSLFIALIIICYKATH